MDEAQRKMNAAACHNPTAQRIRIKPLMSFESKYLALFEQYRTSQAA
jgi:hypothetical protein